MRLPPDQADAIWQKKRKRDPAFDARARAIMATRRPGGRGHVYPREVWEACIASIAKVGIARTSTIAGMPSFSGIYMKFWRDKEFRRRVIAVRPDSRPTPIGEKLRRRLCDDSVYRAILLALPDWLDPDMRDDVASDLVLAVLEGDLQLGDLSARTDHYLRKHRRLFKRRDVVSLDAPIRDGTRMTLHEILAAP